MSDVVKCPDCDGDAVYDIDEEVFGEKRPVVLCLQKECLHWEYIDTGDRD